MAEAPSFTKLVFRMLGRTIKDMLCISPIAQYSYTHESRQFLLLEDGWEGTARKFVYKFRLKLCWLLENKTNKIYRHIATNNRYMFQFCWRCQQSTWSSTPYKHLHSSNSSMCPVVPSGPGKLFIQNRDISCCVEGGISELVLY